MITIQKSNLSTRISHLIKKIDEKFNKQFKVTIPDNYKNFRSKIFLECRKCGREYHYTPQYIFYHFNGCRSCYLKNYAFENYNLFLSNLNKKFPNHTYKIISTYKNMKFPIVLQCTKCGNRVVRFPISILKSNLKCNYCNYIKKYSHLL